MVVTMDDVDIKPNPGGAHRFWETRSGEALYLATTIDDGWRRDRAYGDYCRESLVSRQAKRLASLRIGAARVRPTFVIG